MNNRTYWLLTAVFATVMMAAGGGATFYYFKAAQVERTGSAYSEALERSMGAISEQWRLEESYDDAMPGYQSLHQRLDVALKAVDDAAGVLTACERQAVTDIKRDFIWQQPRACPATSNSHLVAMYRDSMNTERAMYAQLDGIRNEYGTAKAATLEAHAAFDATKQAFVAVVGEGKEPLTAREAKVFVEGINKKFHNLTGVTAIFALLLLVMLASADPSKMAREATD